MTLQTTTFKGARYLVKFHDPIEWASTESYEAIEAVQHNAFTYISKQPVPAGVQIDNTDFWLLWADPNAQMEELRQLVSLYVDEITALDTAVDAINDALPIADFDSVNTVSKAITLDTTKARVFATVADMIQSDTLVNGMICYTSGFYAANDGGACWYAISDTASGLLPETLDSGLYANRIDEGRYNALSLGFKRDNASDNKPVMDAVVDYSRNNNTVGIELYFPSGIYRFSPTTIKTFNFSIVGDAMANGGNDQDDFTTIPAPLGSFNNPGTIFAPMGNQEFIIKYGSKNSSDYINVSCFMNLSMKNICFYCGKPTAESRDISALYSVSDAAFICSRIAMSNIENVNYLCIFGTGLKIEYGYENIFGDAFFRFITPYGNAKNGAMVITKASDSATAIGAVKFGFMFFEETYGSLIEFRDVSATSDVVFEGFSFEDIYIAGFNNTEVETESFNHMPLVYINTNDKDKPISITIPKIYLNNIGAHTYTSNLDSATYRRDVVVSMVNAINTSCYVCINNLVLSSNCKEFFVGQAPNTNMHGWHELIVQNTTRVVFTNATTFYRLKYLQFIGNFTYINLNSNTMYRGSTTFRGRSIEGLKPSDLRIYSSQIQTSDDGNPVIYYPSKFINLDSDFTNYQVDTNAGYSLKCPDNPAITDESNFYFMSNFLISTRRGTFVAVIAQLDTNTEETQPIVDAITAGGVRENLTVTRHTVAGIVSTLSIDCSNITESHYIFVQNAYGNDNNNVLLGYYWL